MSPKPSTQVTAKTVERATPTVAYKKKVEAILYGSTEDKVNPAEFVLYLLESHRENGLARPISSKAFGSKAHPQGRDHYLTEVLADMHNRGLEYLPEPLATALANLTGTDFHFWQRSSYSLKDADGLTLDMSKDIWPEQTQAEKVAGRGKASVTISP